MITHIGSVYFGGNVCFGVSSALTSRSHIDLLTFSAVFVLIVKHVTPSEVEALSDMFSFYFLLLFLWILLSPEILERRHSHSDQHSAQLNRSGWQKKIFKDIFYIKTN